MAQSNFDKVHSEYRSARELLQPERTMAVALEELRTECRRELKRRGSRFRSADTRQADTLSEACLVFPESRVDEHRVAVAERLAVEKDRLRSKMIVFYISFAVFFILLPLGLLYLLLAFLIWLFRDLKISK